MYGAPEIKTVVKSSKQVDNILSKNFSVRNINMGFVKSIFRLISSLFGLAQGQTERATDALVTSSPEAIRAQFRKTKEDWTKDYHDMRDALSELIRIREMKTNEVHELQDKVHEIENKMAGAIELFKRTPDPRYREAYGQAAEKKVSLEERIHVLEEQLTAQNKTIQEYKGRLIDLQKQIDELSKEEAETVADIVSSDKIRELNDRLSGLSNDAQNKNLEAIRETRQKANIRAKLSTELSGGEELELDRQIAQAGAGVKYLGDFDAAVAPKQIAGEKTNIIDAAFEEELVSSSRK